jgi:Fe-S-cluster containining protein
VESPWYKEGLAFECTGCGACCTGEPGYVWVSYEEIQNMAHFLGMTLDSFTAKYVRRAEGKYSLKESQPHNDCVFLKDKKCQIYPVRPKQCRTFPFWPHCLETAESWEKTAKNCEGIGKGKARVDLSTINSILEGKS